jgi:hypothetical protein
MLAQVVTIRLEMCHIAVDSIALGECMGPGRIRADAGFASSRDQRSRLMFDWQQGDT